MGFVLFYTITVWLDMSQRAPLNELAVKMTYVFFLCWLCGRSPAKPGCPCWAELAENMGKHNAKTQPYQRFTSERYIREICLELLQSLC